MPANGDTKEGDSELPGYTTGEGVNGRGAHGPYETEHAYELKNTKGRAWLNLRLRSRAPNKSSLPLFMTEDEIKGEVQVDLEKAESSKGVVIAVSMNALLLPRASLTNMGKACWREHCRWSRACGIPQRRFDTLDPFNLIAKVIWENDLAFFAEASGFLLYLCDRKRNSGDVPAASDFY